MRRLTILTLLIIAVLSISCSKLRQNAVTVSMPGENFGQGEIVYFRFNITDTIPLYKVFLTTRFSRRYILSELPLSLLYISPSGIRYTDTMRFYLNNGDFNTEHVKNGNWRDYRWLYRDGVSFPEKGVWLISVKNIHVKKLSGIEELGISLMQKR